MSEKYSIGEVAKKLKMTPRAIRFYEEKNLVTPDSIGKNGYRYYQEKQIQKLELVNYLRELDFSISQIKSLFNDQCASDSLQLLFRKQISENEKEILLLKQRQKQLQRLVQTVTTRKMNLNDFTNIAQIMKKEAILTKLRSRTLFFGLILIELIGVASAYYFGRADYFDAMILSIIVMLILVIFLSAFLTKYYYSQVQYICPNCGTKFIPSLARFTFSPHTPKFRKLECPNCHHKSYCLEIAR
ncbi:MerR family transcriptional regulator [Limosilactobacillus agrestimuris]|uniref:MerR family transcriptional regulator n=1 Tax=Limosilactobacillus agrestimuris TaxID=2941331 RepID=UPI002041AB07|nr:MerR family transcriptional regulator [Limosilactobacillus agrestimuris]